MPPRGRASAVAAPHDGNGMVATGWAYGDEVNTTAQVVGATQQAFADQVRVEISSPTVGKLMVLRTMLPPIRGGKNGWFDLRDLDVSETEIRGSVSINPLSAPKVRIDRLTGLLKIDGKAGTFAGECEAYDPATVKRAS